MLEVSLLLDIYPFVIVLLLVYVCCHGNYICAVARCVAMVTLSVVGCCCSSVMLLW